MGETSIAELEAQVEHAWSEWMRLRKALAEARIRALQRWEPLTFGNPPDDDPLSTHDLGSAPGAEIDVPDA